MFSRSIAADRSCEVCAVLWLWLLPCAGASGAYLPLQVRDLLRRPESPNSKDSVDLKVRQHPDTGPYVEVSVFVLLKSHTVAGSIRALMVESSPVPEQHSNGLGWGEGRCRGYAAFGGCFEPAETRVHGLLRRVWARYLLLAAAFRRGGWRTK